MTSTDETPQAERPTRWVTFQLAGENYAVNVLNVHEVLKNAELTPVPGAPASVIGIINLRGNVVTVMDGRQRFSLPSMPMSDASRILILEVGQQVLGLLVDSVAEVIELPADEVEASPAVNSDDSSVHIHGVISRPGGLVILLNLDNLTQTVKVH
ncbi:MAG: chemotaxis protein CheW [Halothiobacillaceae bacterium]|nr:MAG: chemotaxis protein CheW [Halothiobacillaceae bacterium]